MSHLYHNADAWKRVTYEGIRSGYPFNEERNRNLNPAQFDEKEETDERE